MQVEASQEALSAMPHKNYGKFARWAQSQRLGMVKQVRVRPDMDVAARHRVGCPMSLSGACMRSVFL